MISTPHQRLVGDQMTEDKTSRALGMYRGADKSLARSGRKQATATKDFDFHISYL
jgi:hypothetical protein